MKTVRIWLLIVAAITITAPLSAEEINAPEPQAGQIIGTVTDTNQNTLAAAAVVLEGLAASDRRTVLTNDNGFFVLKNLKSGIPYHVTIRAEGFALWTSPVITLLPGEYKILTGAVLRIAEARTTVTVGIKSDEIATEAIAVEQVKIEETQRVFGIVPNFYVVYSPEAVRLSTRLKYKLALKLSVDPVTALGIAMLSGIGQASDSPNYGQGAKGFGQRFGANAADGFTNIMIGGAILPALLHQDPRYFYQGTGTKKSRAFHAFIHPFVCKGDNGRIQPNYSSMGGDLASASISNLYYPDSNRGATLVFQNFATSSGERMASALLQEFVLRKLTHLAKKQQ
jgi:hypothetical protein